MDFDLTEEQQLLTDGVSRLLRDEYSFEQRAAALRLPGAHSPPLWQRFADQGLLALPFTEEDGGLGGGPVDLMLVSELFGRHLLAEPWLASQVLAGSCVRAAQAGAVRQALVESLQSGQQIIALAHTERQCREALEQIETTATPIAGGWVIDGAKAWVLGGASAHQLLVTARIAGQGGGDWGLFVAPADAAGIARRGYPLQDGSHAADIELRNVKVGAEARLAFATGAHRAVRNAIEDMTVALCAEAVGVMARAHEITVDYLKQRKQFGVVIGSFQALQHRAVDMLVHIEQARSIVYYATMMLQSTVDDERSRAVSAAKYLVGQAAKFVGEQAVQLHGGIGVTEECQAGHYYRRLTTIELLFGDRHQHLQRLAAAGGLPD